MINIAFLYSELSEYFIGCIKSIKVIKGLNIKVIHWRINQDAPFNFNLSTEYRDKSKFKDTIELKSHLENFAPSVIFTSGWIDKDYIKILQGYRKKHPEVTTIIGLDNPWRGTLKQKLSSLVFKNTLKRSFDYAWVPGDKQVQFAKHLGFKAKFIKKGFYSAEIDNFSENLSKSTFSKRFIFAGRYATEKGILELIQAFKNIAADDWELHCIGTGPLKEQIPEIKGVKHYGFVQPADLPEIMKEGGIFVLPSKFEPWGVVVHEFAAAGFPMILSDQVGAREVFLEEGVNGYSFSWQKKNDLEIVLKQIMKLPEQQLLEMGRKSHEFAQRITPESWANTLMEIIEESSHVRN